MRKYWHNKMVCGSFLDRGMDAIGLSKEKGENQKIGNQRK